MKIFKMKIQDEVQDEAQDEDSRWRFKMKIQDEVQDEMIRDEDSR